VGLQGLSQRSLGAFPLIPIAIGIGVLIAILAVAGVSYAYIQMRDKQADVAIQQSRAAIINKVLDARISGQLTTQDATSLLKAAGDASNAGQPNPNLTAIPWTTFAFLGAGAFVVSRIFG
jgi:hypothetical protein